MYLAAYSDLRTCRPFSLSMGGEAHGPIPWTVIAEYGRTCFGFEGADLTAFIRVIREMDQEELDFIHAEMMERQKQQQKPTRAKPPSGRMGRRG